MSTEFNFDSPDFEFDFEKEINEIASEPAAPIYIEVPLDGQTQVIMDSSSAYSPGIELSNLLSDYAILKDGMSGRLEEIKAINIEIEELRRSVTAQIRLLDIKKQDIETSLFDARRKQRELERQIQSAENRLRQALENERIKKEYQDSSVAFDKLTAGFRWREFALQHQIEGAKHLATAKRAILGDKMGLGKTLTSLIACDMLQAQKILVVVPDDVVSNFVREIQHWAPHPDDIMAEAIASSIAVGDGVALPIHAQ